MDSLLRYTRSRQSETIDLVRRFVECESPSDDAAAVNRFVDLFAANVKDIARVRTYSGGAYGRNLQCEFNLPGGRKQSQILVLGHSDTVWPVGTLRTMPFRQSKGRLWGPGVFDMKGGLALFVTAMRGLRDLGVPVARTVVLQLNSDEEVGSPSSRSLTEEIAKKSAAVLVLEPAAGLDGKVKTARKGVGDYTVTVRGVSSHAGLDFDKGVNAVVEMARQVERIAGFTKLGLGVTVNTGVIRGGTRSNVVPEECTVEVDVRVPRMTDIRYVERQFASLRPFDKRCTVTVAGGVNRPPMERSKGVAALFERAKEVAAGLGIELEECAVGGASDGNLTSALGIPTLDGMGAVGEGAHAVHESILLNRMADRAALLAKLVSCV